VKKIKLHFEVYLSHDDALIRQFGFIFLRLDKIAVDVSDVGDV
jgi:hypothetical protein